MKLLVICLPHRRAAEARWHFHFELSKVREVLIASSYLPSVLELFTHLMTGNDFFKKEKGRKHLFWSTVASPEASIWVPRAGLL